ncbi:antibiotic biosynthesis monooxygenase [Nitrogeniibacter mangrovi]|uniref:Antibiotic biosynthesis monooxygenase n=1 Tax=Nitrogeniibacter mangrovi TaxID=2016596 RepID=A0A6C1B1Y1_9RHOO|nr:antibiotic biosynthesis monooxygenase [Nitrogeniibacter mangrovi]QID17636.1 antibiotic biosynthesis monooxygenase [Nitrogeniibacter mangrovi]
MSTPVVRVAHRRARAGCVDAYEAVLRGMFQAASGFPGFLGADLVPPLKPGDEHRVTMKFASEPDLARWDASDERVRWHEAMAPLTEGPPEYHLLSGLEAWFVPPPLPVTQPPSRARMTLVTWLGIFPTVSLFLWFVAPHLAALPFLPRTALLTALIVITMTYVVMPRLVRWLKPFLHPDRSQ